jgi:hypothetical protein
LRWNSEVENTVDPFPMQEQSTENRTGSAWHYLSSVTKKKKMKYTFWLLFRADRLYTNYRQKEREREREGTARNGHPRCTLG